MGHVQNNVTFVHKVLCEGYSVGLCVVYELKYIITLVFTGIREIMGYVQNNVTFANKVMREG